MSNEESTALAVQDQPVALERPAQALLRPVVSPAELIAVQKETHALIAQALEDGRDYGTIPGTQKPTLYKPGAERCNLAFGVRPEFQVVQAEVDHLVVQVSAMKSYQRIVDLAQKRGLVSLSPSPIAEVTVDLEGLDPLPVTDTDGLRYAGVSSLLDMARQKKER